MSDEPDLPGGAGEQRGLLARLRAVVEARDAENAMLRAELAAALDRERRLVLRVAELRARAGYGQQQLRHADLQGADRGEAAPQRRAEEPAGLGAGAAQGRHSRRSARPSRTAPGGPARTRCCELRELLELARLETGERERCFAEENGKEFWLAVRHAAVPDREGPKAAGPSAETEAEPVSVFILRDVSDAKRLATDRDQLRREQALAEMAAILAHEIRNPLGSLELFAGLLAEAGLSAEGRQWVEHVQAGLRTLAATVNNVLQFHSLPAPERAPVDLGQLLVWAADSCCRWRGSRASTCACKTAQGVLFPADRHRLEQVLLNLVLNSFAPCPEAAGSNLPAATFRRGPGRSGDFRQRYRSGNFAGAQPQNLRARLQHARRQPGAGTRGMPQDRWAAWRNAHRANRPGGGASFR